MLQTTFNDNHFLFILDSAGTITSTTDPLYKGTIIGANGRTESLLPGWFGAIKALNSGLIENVRFLDCDKFGIYGLGNRNHTNDSLTIQNCTFENIAREGSGYAYWGQYITATFINNKVGKVRHGIDNGSEANKTYVLNNIFRGCYYIPVHQHRYKGDSVGLGIVIKNNIFYDPVQLPIDIGVPFSGTNVIENNLFASNMVGKIGRDTIPIGSNKIRGEGMKPAPIISGRTLYQVGERMTLKASGTSEYYWNNGVRGSQTSTTFKQPMVKVFSCYGTGLSDTATVLCTDTGSYFGFFASGSGGYIEVYSGEKLLKTIKPAALYKYNYYLFREPNVYLKVYGGGNIYLENVVCSGGFYDTFEEGVKVKLKYYGTGISVSRPYVNQLDGFRCLMIGTGTGYVEVGR